MEGYLVGFVLSVLVNFYLIGNSMGASIGVSIFGVCAAVIFNRLMEDK